MSRSASNAWHCRCDGRIGSLGDRDHVPRLGTPVSSSANPLSVTLPATTCDAVDRRQRAGRVDQAVAERAAVVGEGQRRGQVGVDRRAHGRERAERGRAGVGSGEARRHRRRGGDALGVVEDAADRARRVRHRLEQEAVARGGCRCGDVDAKAVDDAAGRQRLRRAVRETRQAIATAGSAGSATSRSRQVQILRREDRARDARHAHARAVEVRRGRHVLRHRVLSTTAHRRAPSGAGRAGGRGWPISRTTPAARGGRRRCEERWR